MNWIRISLSSGKTNRIQRSKVKFRNISFLQQTTTIITTTFILLFLFHQNFSKRTVVVVESKRIHNNNNNNIIPSERLHRIVVRTQQVRNNNNIHHHHHYRKKLNWNYKKPTLEEKVRRQLQNLERVRLNDLPTLRSKVNDRMANIVNHLSNVRDNVQDVNQDQGFTGIITSEYKIDGAINERPRRNEVDRPHQNDAITFYDDNTISIPQSSLDNQKINSNFDPLHVRSHLYHAIEGLDRYPNYLSRWNNDNDILRLEFTLLQYAKQVRTELEKIQYKRQHIFQPIVKELTVHYGSDNSTMNECMNLLTNPPTSWETIKNHILHPDAVHAIFNSRMWSTYNNNDTTNPFPTVADVIQGRVPITLDIPLLTEIMEEELFDVYSMPLLRPEFCKAIQSYITEFLRMKSVNEQNQFNPNENTTTKSFIRPTDLDWVGLGWINDLLFHLILKPLNYHLFQTSETKGELDWRQGYVAGYSVVESNHQLHTGSNLITHTDDSDVTLNLCLSDENEFDGGQVEFYGLRGTKEQGTLIGTYQPTIGRGIVHAGRHFHRVTQVTAGNRYVCILWARSWQGIRSESCSCCWLNRRRVQPQNQQQQQQQKNDDLTPCICSSKWN